jgi:glycosyltransferase involved in cell wall biosynthesis
VRNAGLNTATGDVVITCDADSRPHPKIFTAIERCMRANVFAGGVRIWASEIKWNWYPAFWFVNLVSWTSRLPCGMFFLRRHDLKLIGGFDESLFALEDVAFARKLRSEARRRKMKISILLGYPIMTSTRKFRFGKMRQLLMMGGRGMLNPKKYLTNRAYWNSTYYGENLRDSVGSSS